MSIKLTIIGWSLCLYLAWYYVVKPKFHCRLSPKLTCGESSRHKSWKSRTQTISTCRYVCDKIRDKSATNPFVSF